MNNRLTEQKKNPSRGYFISVVAAALLSLPISNTAIGYGVTYFSLSGEPENKRQELVDRMINEYPALPLHFKALALGNYLACRQLRE